MLVHLAIFRRARSVLFEGAWDHLPPRALDAYFESHREAVWRALSSGGHRDCRCVAMHCTHSARSASVSLFSSPPLKCNGACTGHAR
jgi:hypothetical protein